MSDTPSPRCLYLLRHGLADRSAWRGDDFERPLTSAGRKRMARAADTMARLGLRPDVIISSPLIRAWQTAVIVAERLQVTDRLHKDDRVAFGFDARMVTEILATHPQAREVMLVGHEPTFSLIIGEITGGSEVVCKKGGLARIDLHREDPPAGILVWLIPPKALTL